MYLELIGGRQPGLELISTQTRNITTSSNDGTFKREVPLPSLLTDTEKKAHDAFIKLLGEKCLWTKGTN